MKPTDFDAYSSNYDALLNEGTRFFSASENYFARYKVEVIRKRTHRPVRRILEYGCGIGRNIPFLHKAFPDALIMGTDISGESLALAKERYPYAQFFQGTVPPASEPYDLILVACVYHHIPPQERGSSSHVLCDMLSPAGDLFVFEHNPFNPVTQRIVSQCAYDKDAILLKPQELTKHLREAGLKCVEQEYCLLVPPKLAALVFLEALFKKIPFGGQYWIRATK